MNSSPKALTCHEGLGEGEENVPDIINEVAAVGHGQISTQVLKRPEVDEVEDSRSNEGAKNLGHDVRTVPCSRGFCGSQPGRALQPD